MFIDELSACLAQCIVKSHVPVSTVFNQEPRYVFESAMINDILLNIVFFAEFSLNVNFLCVSVIEVIFLTGNFNQKFSSTCCAFRMNDDFCLPKSF